MKQKQIWLTAQEIDLMTAILANSQVVMKRDIGQTVNASSLMPVCLNYCSRRVDEILAKLGVTPK